MPSAYLIPTAGRFGRGESRKENRRTEAEICLQRHRRDGRGEESTTTPDEGSERKGVSRAQGGGGEGGAPPQDQPQALDVRAASLAEEAAAARVPGKHGRVRKTGVHSSVLWDQGVGNSLNTEHRERVGHTGVGRRGHRVRSVERWRN